MKILVYGAGVLGSVYAVRLQEAGQDVSILARGQRLADIRAQGIILEDALNGQRTTTFVRAVERLAPEDAYDWVLVLMRRNQVAAILPDLAANRHTPNILFMHNNASGPAEMIKALGYERVVLGFPGAGGRRQGAVIYAVTGTEKRKARTTIGEIDGRMTPRLQQIAGIFESARFSVMISRNMDAWLKTHVALILPIALAIYMAGGDNYRLARTRDALVILVRAVQEGLRVLNRLDVPITPPNLKRLAGLPEPILIAFLQRLLNTRMAEIGIAGHANAAHDEMQALADEFRSLARTASVPTPTLDQLYGYLDPALPSLREGSAVLPLNWRSIWAGLGVLLGLIVLVRFVSSRRY